MEPDSIWGPIILQLFFIIISSFFSSAEIAIISLNDSKLKKDSNEEFTAKIISNIISSPNNFLTTNKICINITGYLASAFTALNFSNKLVKALSPSINFITTETLKIILIILLTFVLVFIMMLFGDMIPRKIGANFHIKISAFTGPIVWFFNKLFYPIAVALNWLTELFSKLFKFSNASDSTFVTEEEIRLMMDIGAEKGTINTDEKTMIENIFEFDNLTAEDVMVHRTDVQAININESNENIIKIITESGLSRFPVYNEDIDDIVGVLSSRKFLLNLQSENQKPLIDIVYEPYIVPSSIQADVLFKNMQKYKTHLSIIVDEYGGMSGIVTMEDLIEEIMGNIYDENDHQDEVDILKLQPNLWKIAGTAEIENINKELNIKLPLDEEYDTLGGLIFNNITLIPEDGTKFELLINGLKIKVLKIEDHRIINALVSKIIINNDNKNKETETNKNNDKAWYFKK